MAVVDIHSLNKNNDARWIPYPIKQYSPLYSYSITLNEILILFHHPEIIVRDSETKTNITMSNLEDYFPEWDPGGGSGYSKKEIDTKIQGLQDSIDDISQGEIDIEAKNVEQDESINTINEELVLVNERIDAIDVANETVVQYEQNKLYVIGKIVWLEPGELYQVTRNFTSNHDPDKTIEESFMYDISNNNLAPVTDSEIGDLGDRVDTIENEIVSIDQSITEIQNSIDNKVDKIAGKGLSANDYTDEDMALLHSIKKQIEFDSFIEFPTVGEPDVLYIDTNDGKSYIWDSDIIAYRVLNVNNIDLDEIQVTL